MESLLNAWIQTYHFIIILQLTPVSMKAHSQVLMPRHESHQRRKGCKKRVLPHDVPPCQSEELLSVRPKFHNLPLELSPPPGEPVH